METKSTRRPPRINIKSRSTLKPSVVNITQLPRSSNTISSLLLEYVHKMAKGINRHRIYKVRSSWLSQRMVEEPPKSPQCYNRRLFSSQEPREPIVANTENSNMMLFKVNQRNRSKNTSISDMNVIKAQSLQAHTKAIRSKRKGVCDFLSQMRYSMPSNQGFAFSTPVTPESSYRVADSKLHSSINQEEPEGKTNKRFQDIFVLPMEFPYKLKNSSQKEKQELLPLLLSCKGAPVHKKRNLFTKKIENSGQADFMKGELLQRLHEKRRSCGTTLEGQQRKYKKKQIKWDVKVPCINVDNGRECIKTENGEWSPLSPW